MRFLAALAIGIDLFNVVAAHHDDLTHEEILVRRASVAKRSLQLATCGKSLHSLHRKRALNIEQKRQSLLKRDTCYGVVIESLSTESIVELLVVNGNFELVAPITVSSASTIVGATSSYTYGLSTSTLTSINHLTSSSLSTICGVASAPASTITLVDGSTVTGGSATSVQTVVGTVTVNGQPVVTTVLLTADALAVQTATAVVAGQQSASASTGGATYGDQGTGSTVSADGPTASSSSSSQGVSSSLASSTISGQLASASKTAENSTCAIFPEEEEGPYYISGEYIRSNLVDGLSGIPLALHINLIDTSTCEPLANAAVDIWSASPLGVYSGFTLSGSGGEAAFGSSGGSMAGSNTTFMGSSMSAGFQQSMGAMPTGAMPSGSPPSVRRRAVNGNIVVGTDNDAGSNVTDSYTYSRGIQITDNDGAVAFDTLVPGWYSGRTMHIHLKVHLEGETLANGTYVGGTIYHGGQMFFGADISDIVAQDATYAANTVTRTTNDVDSVYTAQSGEDSLLTVYYVSGTDLSAGLIGELTLGIDTTHAAATVATDNRR